MFIENQHVHVHVRVPLCSEDDLKRTLEKVKSYSQQHSTKASQLFFQDWKSHQDEDDDDDLNNDSILWKTLPLRIDLVTQFYLKNPELAITETRSIHLCSDDPMQSRRLALTASIISSAPRNLWLNFARLFQEILNTKCRAMEESMEESDDDDDDSEGEEKEVESLDFDEKKLYQNLKTLKWLDGSASQYQAIISRPLSQALQSSIFKHVSEHIAGEFEDDTLFASLLEWKTSVLHPFLMDVLCCSSTTQQASPNVLEVWDHKLNHTIAECFCQVRKGELFDMIRDYPDSLPGIQDLNKALQLTRMTSQLMDSLKGSFQQRLLHPGVETGQILQIYINTIKVLRVMDPTDGLLESVATGIRSYLRGRADTVRNIITSLTDEKDKGDLYEELQRHDAIPLEQAQYDSDEEEEQPDFNWTPAPSLYYQRTSGNVQTSQLAPDGNKDSSNKASADILSMLVGIYGTNDLFVDEYRIMLADKLLANADFDTDKEVRNLELLKIRFGETSMRQCEIMIKDIDDSKRDSKRIASNMKGSKSEEEENNIPCIDAAIISHIFWPPLQKDSMKNHPRIQSSLDKFSMEYAKYKNPRRLVWFHQLGQVELELDVVEDDGQVVTTQFTCSPLHATLISHFEDGDGCWTSTDLANETGVPEETIKKKMGYWINQNVVRVSRNGYVSTYELISSNDEDNALDGEHIQYDDDDEGLMVSKSGQEAEELEAYESYIVGMLSNLGELSLNRIHNTLKMFVTGSEIKYNKTPQQLSVLLQRLCKEEKLECGADGMYKLLKK